MLNLFKKKPTEVELFAVGEGTTLPITEVNDPVFAQKMMGEGIAFNLTSNVVCAPCDGEVLLVADTLHAVGLKADNGAELLIHIGLETVALKGEGFKNKVGSRKRVRKGDALIEFDPEFMKSKNIDMTTMVIITNSNDHPSENYVLNKQVTKKDAVVLVK